MPRRPSKRKAAMQRVMGTASRPRDGNLLWSGSIPGLPSALIGVLLIALAVLSLLGLVGITEGSLIDRWVGLLRLSVGWAALPLVLLLLLVGLRHALARGQEPQTPHAKTLVGLELLAVAFLGLLQILAGRGPAPHLAEAGQAGGYFGWAIVYFLDWAVGPLAMLGVLLLTAAVGLVLAWDVAPRSLLAALGRTLHNIVYPPWRNEDRASAERPARKRPAPTPEHKRPARSAPAPAAEPAAVAATAAPAPVEEPAILPIPAEVQAEAQADLPPARPAPAARRGKRLPPLTLLIAPSSKEIAQEELRHRAHVIEQTLASFGLPARVVKVSSGPTVTQFGVEPGFVEVKGRQRKVRVGKIVSLQNDLALALAASRIRIQAPVPGYPYVGIEVPNTKASLVPLRRVLESKTFTSAHGQLKLALGQDVSGEVVVYDLGVMPHLLIAGATGSGKSVCINSLILSLLCQRGPTELKFILIDPKRVELTPYNGLPHLWGSVINKAEQAARALIWVQQEMEDRYQKFARQAARNLEAYNHTASEPLPYLVIVIDELADLMMTAPEETERLVTRIAQMARATGIHLMLATQRPSVDVVTGLIKANFPARIAFTVTSNTDSRVILDQPGAEKLLGRGDMLFLPPDQSAPTRLQGCYVSEREVEAVVGHWKEVAGYEVTRVAPWHRAVAPAQDELLEEAIQIARRHRQISPLALSRELHVGPQRAERLLATMEERGLLTRLREGDPVRRVLQATLEDTELDEDEPDDAL